MRTRSAAELAALIEAGGEPCTVTADPDTVVGPAVVIDSRQATSGALFVALPGENVDGHDYVAAAAALGATAFAGLGVEKQFNGVIAPMIIAAVGIILSIFGIFLVKAREGASQKQLLAALGRGVNIRAGSLRQPFNHGMRRDDGRPRRARRLAKSSHQHQALCRLQANMCHAALAARAQRA